MNEWREKVEAALIEAGRAWERGDRSRSLTDMYAQAAIAELLPLLKAELAKDNEAAAQRVRDLIAASGSTDARVVALMTLEQRTAAIEAWEPEA